MAQNGSANPRKSTMNGDTSHSQTLDHVTSYPLVDDLLKFYQSNSFGAKSISVFRSFYSSFAEPVMPYLQTPYSIAHPYLQRADSFGDESLKTIDQRFPALQETDYEKLKTRAQGVASYPFQLADSTKNYVFSTFDDESKKVGGEGYVHLGKSIVSTELRLASEIMHAVGDFLKPRKEAMEAKYDETKTTGSEYAHRMKKEAQFKLDEALSSH